MSTPVVPPDGIPDGIEQITDPAPGWRIDTPQASAIVLRQGAQLISWTPRGHDDVLWLSDAAAFAPHSVRGGVPICFPYFANGPHDDLKPAHGGARTTDWSLVGASVDAAGTATLALQLTGADLAGRPGAGGLPADAAITVTFTLGSTLRIEATVTSPNEPCHYEVAFHTYFAVEDARQVRVSGLDAHEYSDRPTGRDEHQSGDITFDGSVVDRFFLADGDAQIRTPQRVITISKQHSADTVVWNPGTECVTLGDVHPDAWRHFVCVETVNARAAAIDLDAGGSHTMTATIRVQQASA